MAPKQESAFLRFPFDVYLKIYDEVLRPDQAHFGKLKDETYNGRYNAAGCTNILQLNRQIYSQALSFIEQMPVDLMLKGNGRRLFRHPLGNGKPSLFYSDAPTSAVYIPNNLSELQFINLSTVKVWIFEDSNKPDFHDLHQAIKKSHTLRDITFKCQVSGLRWGSYISCDRDRVKLQKHLIRPIINTCIDKGIKVHVEANGAFPPRPYISTHGVCKNDYDDPLAKYLLHLLPLQHSNAALTKTRAEYLTQHGELPLRSFTLTPECRACYAVFASQAALTQHLTTHPQHKTPFVRKKYNWIHPLARHGGYRHTCLVCARGYESNQTLEEHIEKFGHQRDRSAQGVVPRYVGDNAWFQSTGEAERRVVWAGEE